MAVLNSAERRTSLALSVALHHGLAEDLTTASIADGGLDLLLCSFGADNAILAAHLLLDGSLEFGLDTLVLGDDGLDLSIDSAHMLSVGSSLSIGPGLDLAHTLDKGTVGTRGLGGEGIQLEAGRAGRGGVGVTEDSGLKHFDLSQAGFDLADFVADFTALVEERVGVFAGHAAGVLRQRSHLDRCGCKCNVNS